jgi:regulatory protein
MKTQDTAKACFAAAMRLLARRDHSCWELSFKLAQRKFPQDEIQWAIDQCLNYRYLDDERYACGYVKQLQRRGYGCRRIEQMLVAKGLEEQIIAACLAPCCRAGVQIRDCRNAMAKKLQGNLQGEVSAQTRARLYRFLFKRGFPTDIVRQVLKEGLMQSTGNPNAWGGDL